MIAAPAETGAAVLLWETGASNTAAPASAGAMEVLNLRVSQPNHAG